MKKINFTDGYQATIDSIYITKTYGDVICGSPPKLTLETMVSKRIRCIDKLWGNDRPWTYIIRTKSNLIGYKETVYLWLDSNLIPNKGDCFCGSHAFIAVTLDIDFSVSLIEQIQEVIGHLKWAEIAQNWDF